MLEFDVFQFVRHSDTLQVLQREIEERADVPLAPQERQVCAAKMQEIMSFLTGFEIDVGQCFERIELKIHQPEKATPKLSQLILELRNRINDDLMKRLFMFIPNAEAVYYNNYDLFGVKDRFPKANTEITEAGNCYATGNYTACVFHLMRAVEYGARKMVIALNARKYLPHPKRPIELCDWGDLEKALDKSVADLNVGSRSNLNKKATYEFYNHAVAQFRNFKNAWRNNVSHTRKTYQPGQTKDIMDNTRQFMKHLASRLKE